MKPPRGRPVAAATAVMLALAVTACAGERPSPSPSASALATPTAEPTAAPTSAAAEPTDVATPTAVPTPPPIAADPPPLGLTVVASGIDAPINIEGTPDGWLYVNERRGRVIAIPPEGPQARVVLDLTDRVLGGGEQGLLGLAFDPEEPRAFVHYTDRNGDTVVSELSISGGGAPLQPDPGSERVLLRVDQPYSNHNGGQLAFGPDGYLYLGLGDGGAGGDPHGNGQNPSALLGSILRIDVNGDEPYAIPPDNPFADGSGGAPEVFLYGLRNPWRFSFDRATGQLWIGDVGQNAFEEIDRVDPAADAGANLGWNRMEASHCYVADCSSDGLLLPVTEYGHDAGCSVSGGFVYRGSAIEGLAGWYLFSDYCSGLIFGIPSDAEPVAPARVLLQTGLSIAAFGQDAAGELYVADIDGGGIYRIVPGG